MSSDEIGLMTVFELAPSSLTRDMASSLFKQVLAGHRAGLTEDRIDKAAEARARLWEKGWATAIDYYDHADLTAPLSIQLYWPNSGIPGSEEITLDVPVAQGHRLVAFAIMAAYLDETDQGQLQFYREKMVQTFDLLRPTWGCTDRPQELGLGGHEPSGGPYWLNFFGPSRAQEAFELADLGDTSLDEREWGGFVVEHVKDPFNPRSASRAKTPPAEHARDAEPSGDGFPTWGVLVAGAPLSDAGQPTPEARSNGQLRTFRSIRGQTILGLKVADVPLTGTRPFLDAVGEGVLEEALAEAEAALAKGNAAREVGAYLLLTDDASVEGS